MIIIGNRAVGKTTFGKKLSRLTGIPCFDSDEEITKEFDIQTLFDQGEFAFRVVEERVILELLTQKKGIIVLGGGAVMNPNVRHVIEQSDHKVLWITCDETLRQERLRSLNRPNVDDSGRDKLYMSLADEVIDISGFW